MKPVLVLMFVLLRAVVIWESYSGASIIRNDLNTMVGKSGASSNRGEGSRLVLQLKVFLERVAHNTRIGINAGPDLEPDYALVDQHTESIKCLATAAGSFAEEHGFRRIENDIGSHHVGVERPVVNRDASVSVAPPDRRGIDDNVCALLDLVVSLPGDQLGGYVDTLIEQVDKLLTALGRPVDDRDFGSLGKPQFHSNGSRRAAGPQNHDFPSIGDGQFSQRMDESFTLGVFANKLVTFTVDAVDGAHQLRCLAETVQMIDHRYFVWDGEVAAAEAHRPHASHSTAQVFRRNFQCEIAPIVAAAAKARSIINWVGLSATGWPTQQVSC